MNKSNLQNYSICLHRIIYLFKCHYCNYQTNIEKEYEQHVVMRHPGKLAYTSKVDLEKEALN
jgi:hypothetical protein